MKILTKEELIEIIKNAKVDERIDLRDTNFSYDLLVFDTDGMGFSWCLHNSWEKNRCIGYVFPKKDSRYVKYFKTLNGAKRNVIKKYVESEWSWVKT